MGNDSWTDNIQSFELHWELELVDESQLEELQMKRPIAFFDLFTQVDELTRLTLVLHQNLKSKTD